LTSIGRRFICLGFFSGLDDFGVEGFNRLKLLVRRGFDRGLLILGHGLQSFNRLKLFGLAVLVGWLVGWGWLVGGWLVGGVGVRCDGWVFLVFLRRAMGWGEDSVLCSVGDGAVIFFEG
jgi:hypothetical protein